MKFSTFLPAIFAVSTTTCSVLATPVAEKRDLSSVLSTLRSDIFAHTAALTEKFKNVQPTRDAATGVLNELIPTMKRLSNQAALRDAGWKPVLMDFNSGVSGFASDIPVFDSGVLGLVTLLLNLVLGTVGGLPGSGAGLLPLLGELPAIIGNLLTPGNK